MKVFLSHASESKPRVRALAAFFPPHVEVWLDVNELTTGERLPDNIAHAIEAECDYVVVFIDRFALERDWVPREVGWSLKREVDLKRTFLLPVLLEPVTDGLKRLGDLGSERIYLDATDTGPDGVKRAGERLCGELFALSSRLIETLRGTGRRQLLTAFDKSLNEFKQAAFMWLATMANPLPLLATDQEAFDQVDRAVDVYNGVANRFIDALGTHRDRVGAAWAGHRGLTQDFRELLEFAENGVYRGAMFRLNEVIAMVNRLAKTEGRADDLPAQEARRDTLLREAHEALETLTRRSTRCIADLEREI